MTGVLEQTRFDKALEAWDEGRGFSIDNYDTSIDAPWPADEHDPDSGDPANLTTLDRLTGELLDGDAIEELPPPEPLIDGLLDLDTLAVMFGRPGGGKTHIAIDVSLHIATGSWWHGHQVTEGHVLYLVAEGARGVGQRQKAWKHLNGYHASLAGRITWLPVPVNLLGPEQAAALATIASDRQAVLVVIDTLGRSMAGGDENSYRDMSLVIDAAERIRAATGACVWLVHHSGKDQSAGSRGHSSLLGAVHTELEVKNGGDGIITLTTTKQKDHADTAQPWRFVLAPAADSVAITPYTGRQPLDMSISGKALEVLEALRSIDIAGGVTASQWSEVSVQNGVSRSGFYQHRKTLIDTGQVQNVGTEQRARYSVVTRENPDEV